MAIRINPSRVTDIMIKAESPMIAHRPEIAMNRQDIRSHPQLKDLSFKLETDRWGHIVMSPASNRQS